MPIARFVISILPVIRRKEPEKLIFLAINARQKAVLEQTLEALRQETSKIKDSLGNAKDRLEELKIQKQINEKEKQLRKKEEGLFFEQMRIEATAEDEIDLIRGIDGIEFYLYQIFEANFS